MDLKIETKINVLIQSDVISISSTEEEQIVVPMKKPRRNNKKLHNVDISKVLTKKDDKRNKISDFFPKVSSSSCSKSNKEGISEPVLYYEKKQNKSSKIVKKQCPTYKVIEGTTFGVDSFRFGYIDGVTHYFLTHFHADHYIGLTKSFNKPLYLSKITGLLVKVMINVQEKFICPVNLNAPFIINGVEITAIDANHCPGAVMFVFKFTTGKTILHTGDFRACSEMESEPIFWNNDVEVIYLDTTYLSSKYAFKSQWESVKEAQEHVLNFSKKYGWTNILIICGSYLIGKEKVWLNVAEYFNLKVWVDNNRRKVLECLNNSKITDFLVETQKDAQLHVLPINKLHYEFLLEYMKKVEKFEYILALVPSGWQKNSKPIVRGRITIIGIEYSEHSSYDELKRFVKYIKPKKVISTVPWGKDLMKTPKIPQNWLDYDKNSKIGYQKSITNYVKIQQQEVPVEKVIAKKNYAQISEMEKEKQKSLALLRDLIENYDKIIESNEVNVEINEEDNLSEKCEEAIEIENDWMF